MKLSTPTLLLLLVFCFAITLGAVAVMYLKPTELIAQPMLNFGLSAAQFLTALLMLRFGTLTKTVYWRIIKFLFGVVCLGVMFKILHLAGADIILVVSLLGFAFTYLLRFLKKPAKRHLDVLKLLWVVSAFSIKPLITVHWIDRQYFMIPLVFFILVLLDFCVTEKRLRHLIRN